MSLEHTHECNNCQSEPGKDTCYCKDCREEYANDAYEQGKKDGYKEGYEEGEKDFSKDE